MASAATEHRAPAASPHVRAAARAPTRLVLLLAPVLAAALALPAWPVVAQAQGGSGGAQLRTLGSFVEPTYVHGPPGMRGAILVVEKRGTVRVWHRGRTRPGAFLDIRDLVSTSGEQGLLSVAFGPRFPRDPRFYAYYTDPRGDVRIDELRRHPRRAGRAVRSSRRTVLRIRHQPFTNHNGGQLQFAPDGTLLIATGDGGGAGDPQGNAQDLSSLLGKLLRIDPRARGGRAFTVPRNNPFVGRPGRNPILSYGLRNPWRFSLDGRRILIADVGQGRWEELNYLRLADAAGANFGWNRHEGFEVFGDGPPLPDDEHTEPIHVYRTGQGGNCAITGGYVSRDRRLPALRGRYVYADYCRGRLRSLLPRLDGARDDRPLNLRALPQLSSFGVDQRDRLFVASLAGEVAALVPR